MSENFYPEQEVLVKSLNKKGVILQISSKKVKINVNNIEFETTKDDLIARNKKPVKHSITKTMPTKTAKGKLSIDVHGYSVEEALSTLEKELSFCFQNKIQCLSLIHGKGKGILKKAIIEYLQRSELDISYTLIQAKHTVEIKINI